jgi:hypothetical protein
VLAVAVSTLALFGLSVFALWSDVQGSWSLQAFKYPPRIVYLSYGIAVSCVAWAAAGWLTAACQWLRLLELIRFIGCNSIWIYLWHIPVVERTHMHFAARYFVVLAIALALAYLQVRLVNHVVRTRVRSASLSHTLRMVLTG